MARVAPPPAPPEARFYRAEPTSGPDGAVEWWSDPLTEAEATARLKQGEDVVVLPGTTTGVWPWHCSTSSSGDTKKTSPMKGRCPSRTCTPPGVPRLSTCFLTRFPLGRMLGGGSR
jgi:hypothetical protein